MSNNVLQNEIEKPATINIPQLYSFQSMILADPAKVKVCALSRRLGKSVMCGAAALALAANSGNVFYIVPHFQNALQQWHWLNKSVADLRRQKLVSTTKQDMQINFANGGMIKISSSENGGMGLRGNFANLVIMDEFAFMQDVESLYYDVVQAMVLDYAGDIIICSTPRTTGDLFHSLYLDALNDDTGYSAAWNLPTSDSPNETIRAEVLRLKKTMPEKRWRREFMAEFQSTEEGIFTNVREVATAKEQLIGNKDSLYFCGVDVGRTKDATVFAVYDATTNEICHLQVITGQPLSVQAKRLAFLHHRFGSFASILIEQNNIGLPFLDLLREQENLPVVGWITSATSKNALIDKYALAFEYKTISIIPDDAFIQELLAYHGEVMASGLMRYGNKKSIALHDDRVMASALAYWAATNQRRKLEVSTTRWL